MNFVISLEGILRGDTGDLIPEGLIMYRGFHTLGRIVLITDLPQDLAKVWLMMHNLSDYDVLLDNSVSVDPEEPLKQRQLAVARTRGPVNMYVDADPGMVAEALRLGITAVLFSSPKYARPEYRPDAPKGIRKWDDIVAERTRQQVLKTVDTRLSIDDDLGFE